MTALARRVLPQGRPAQAAHGGLGGGVRRALEGQR